MKEYIEREPLIKYCTAMLNLAQRLVQSGYAESDIWKGIHQTQQEERKEFLEILKSAPSADVTPVRHGRWNVIKALSDDIQTAGECNICGENISWFGKFPNYCPNCGALMDGKVSKHEVSE